MKVRNMRKFIFVATAIGIVIAASPLAAQVFSPTRPESSSPKGTGPSTSPSTSPTGPSAGSPSADVTKVCDDIAAKIKALPKAGNRDQSASQPATCAAGGQALGILQAIRVVTAACDSGGAKMNASLLKMFDGFIKGTLEMIAKECK